jgi:3-methyl-2-oxobutanoate hydroxymethyltransferase
VKAGASAVKLEGGTTMFDTIAAISRVDIPVMGHIGLTPQSYHRMGGHRVQGRVDGNIAGGRERLLEDAQSVQQSGAFAMVIEGVPRDLAKEITSTLSIPTIGIGAGPDCDGQVLVLHDILGLTQNTLKFTRKYADIRTTSVDACKQFVDDVRNGSWPDDAHSFH